MATQPTSSPFFWAQKVLIALKKKDVFSRGYPIEIDDVAAAAREISGVAEIRFRFAPFNPDVIAGAFARFEQLGQIGSGTTVEILVSDRLNFCWRRFVACKEICQLFFSDMAGYTNSAEDSEVIAYLDGLLNRDIFRAFSPAIQTDQLAMICAIEILCPFFEREKVFQNLAGGSIDRYSLAVKFRVPERLVEAIFNPTYHENARLSMLANSEIDFRINPQMRNPTSDLEYMFRRNVEEARRENEKLHLDKKVGH